MKNIHVLPTDKPSKLATHYEKMRLIQTPDMWTYEFTKQNIYITSDEEIKEGDWILVPSTDGKTYFDFSNSFPKKAKSNYASNNFVFKIILTTDQDLIKDGVQAIDDEFLEWFVKNPSCEYVEIIPLRKSSGYYDEKEVWHWDFLAYKVIIPKEEIKQETPEAKFQSWDELVREVGSEEELIKILKLPHILPLVREAMKNNCKK